MYKKQVLIVLIVLFSLLIALWWARPLFKKQVTLPVVCPQPLFQTTRMAESLSASKVKIRIPTSTFERGPENRDRVPSGTSEEVKPTGKVDTGFVEIEVDNSAKVGYTESTEMNLPNHFVPQNGGLDARYSGGISLFSDKTLQIAAGYKPFSRPFWLNGSVNVGFDGKFKAVGIGFRIDF